MKYLPLLLLLVGCVTHPKKKGPQLIEEIPMGETWVDDMIEEGIKVGPIDKVQLGAIDFYWEEPILEIDLVSVTGRRFMIYIDVVGG